MVCFRQPQGGDAVSALDVLAANVAVANTTRQNDRYTSIVTCADCAMEAREALAAIAELIEAARQMLSRDSTYDDDDETRLRAAITRVGGAA